MKALLHSAISRWVPSQSVSSTTPAAAPSPSPSPYAADRHTEEGRKRLLQAQEAAQQAGHTYPSIDMQTQSSITLPSQTLTGETRDRLIDCVKGVIYGQAIGDSIGAYTEFWSKQMCMEHYGQHGPVDHPTDNSVHRKWATGDWTDDTDQMLLILDSLLADGGGINIQDFATRLHYWVDHGYTELGDFAGYGCGALTSRVVACNTDFLTQPHETAVRVYNESQGRAAANGSIMRTSILGIPHFDDLPTVIEQTKQIGTVTHVDPRSVAGTIICTTIIAMMLQDVLQDRQPARTVDDIISTAVALSIEHAFTHPTSDHPPGWELEQKQGWIEEVCTHCTAPSLSALRLSARGAIGYALKCIGSAVYVCRHGTNFRDSITELVLEGGDADTNAAVAGALLGCKLGYKQLDQKWLEGLKEREWLDVRVNKFLQLLGLMEARATAPAGPTAEACASQSNTEHPAA